jgi:hypothetical protein
MSTTLSPSPLRRRVAAGLATGLAAVATLMSLPAAAQAQAPVAVAEASSSFSSLDWTGRPESPDSARKEATAALAEARRECQTRKVREDREACLKQAQADHAAMLKRVAARSGR